MTNSPRKPQTNTAETQDNLKEASKKLQKIQDNLNIKSNKDPTKIYN